MKPKEEKEKAIDEIVKIIQKFQYNYELSEKYKREILDQDKIYDWRILFDKYQKIKSKGFLKNTLNKYKFFEYIFFDSRKIVVLIK